MLVLQAIIGNLGKVYILIQNQRNEEIWIV